MSSQEAVRVGDRIGQAATGLVDIGVPALVSVLASVFDEIAVETAVIRCS